MLNKYSTPNGRAVEQVQSKLTLHLTRVNFIHEFEVIFSCLNHEINAYATYGNCLAGY